MCHLTELALWLVEDVVLSPSFTLFRLTGDDDGIRCLRFRRTVVVGVLTT